MFWREKSHLKQYKDRPEAFRRAVEEALRNPVGGSPPLSAIDKLAALVQHDYDIRFLSKHPELKRIFAYGDNGETHMESILRHHRRKAHSDPIHYNQYVEKGARLLDWLDIPHDLTMPLPPPLRLDVEIHKGAVILSLDGQRLAHVPAPHGVDLSRATVTVNGESIKKPEMMDYEDLELPHPPKWTKEIRPSAQPDRPGDDGPETIPFPRAR